MSENKGNSLEVLEEFIERGQPPEFIAFEYSSRGETHAVFTWLCGTMVKVKDDSINEYHEALTRFREFWA